MLKRKVLYLVALVCVIIVNVLYIEDEPFILLVIMILFPIVLRILLIIQNKNFEIDIETQNKIVCQGETVEISNKVFNKLRLPISNIVVNFKMKYFNYDEESIHSFNFGIDGNTNLELSTKIIPNYCGKVFFNVEKVTIFDYLSLFKTKSSCSFNASIIVMPKLYEQTHNKERVYNTYLSEGDEYSQEKPGDDPSEVFELRDYAEGDNLNRIHWKLSSKGEGIIVKEYSFPVTKTEVVLVELLINSSVESSEGERENIDSIYQTAYALGNYYCQNGIAFQLVYYDKSTSNLKAITIDNLISLQTAVIDMIDMIPYEIPYAWNNFWTSDISEYSRLHYIMCKDYEKSEYVNAKVGKSGECLSENNIILADENNIQEIVDSFYLKV